jgi:adenine phosphoribosyltransferase
MDVSIAYVCSCSVRLAESPFGSYISIPDFSSRTIINPIDNLPLTIDHRLLLGFFLPLSPNPMDLKALIRNIPDFPKPGILFRDITTLLQDPAGLQYTIDTMAAQISDLKPEYLVGMESRGFIFGAALAYKLGIGFIPVRKPGKLPAKVHVVEYALEYGTDRLEMHQDAVTPGARVVIVDDLIATGGTAVATAQLLKEIGAHLVGCVFVIELDALNGRSRLPDVPINSLVHY